MNDLPDDRVTRRRIDEFVGVCRAMSAKPVLTEKDVRVLDKWLSNNRSLEDWPMLDEVADGVAWVFEQGFDDESIAGLQKTLRSFVGGQDPAAPRPTTLPLDDPPPEVTFYGKLFCLTGTFDYGTRNECLEAIQDRGGSVGGGMRAKTDYLVIGNNVTETWVHSNFGRKFADAVAWQDKGYPISIVSEEHWRRALRAAPITGPRPPDPPAPKPPSKDALFAAAYDRYFAREISEEQLDELLDQVTAADKSELHQLAEDNSLHVEAKKPRPISMSIRMTPELIKKGEAKNRRRKMLWMLWPVLAFLISYGVMTGQFRERSQSQGATATELIPSRPY